MLFVCNVTPLKHKCFDLNITKPYILKLSCKSYAFAYKVLPQQTYATFFVSYINNFQSEISREGNLFPRPSKRYFANKQQISI